MRTAVGAALLALTTAGFVTAMAAEPEPPRGVLALQIENDLFAGTDRNYTSGLRIAYATPMGPSHPLESSVRALSLFEGDLRATYSLGQTIFTPIDISETELITADEPYAGYLYAGFGIEPELRLQHGRRILDSFELQVGIVGPSASGKQTQLAAHNITGSIEARGWDNQLDDEPTLNVYFDRVWSSLYETGIGEAGSRYSVDVSPHVGAALGNVYTYAAGGATLRFGRNLPTALGPRSLRPGPPGSDYYKPTPETRWHLFLGLEGRAVAHSIFLDGNTFKESHSVDKHAFVGELRAGISAMLGRTRLAYAQVFRTTQFHGQIRETFGALSLSTAF
ncbi:MAG: lipid A deacylase LpxR family protein [Betaproteobacteria bacterium]